MNIRCVPGSQQKLLKQRQCKDKFIENKKKSDTLYQKKYYWFNNHATASFYTSLKSGRRGVASLNR